jgi:DNA-binding CsgD family transcriptional regulator
MRYYSGDVAQALDQLPRAVDLAERKGLTWSPYGVEARVVYVIALYVAGQWDASLEAAALAGARPPDVAAARLATAGLYVLVGRGDAAAAARVAELKRAWHYDTQIALVAGGCETDLLSWQGDSDAAVRAANDAIAFVSRTWGDWYLGGIWLAALALAAHADAAAQARLRGLEVSDALSAGRALVEDAQRRFGRGRPRTGTPGPEAVAWLARAEAEWSRLQAEADPAPWETALKAFSYGYPYEEARTRWRLAETLVASGRRDEASAHVTAAHATALKLGAAPLAQAVEGLVRRARLDVSLPTSTAARPAGLDTLTAREHEVLALLAEGRTNGQIGRALFISPKTASVHVSNLIAKLGATSRTEVVALAYQRGLLDRAG